MPRDTQDTLPQGTSQPQHGSYHRHKTAGDIQRGSGTPMPIPLGPGEETKFCYEKLTFVYALKQVEPLTCDHPASVSQVMKSQAKATKAGKITISFLHLLTVSLISGSTLCSPWAKSLFCSCGAESQAWPSLQPSPHSLGFPE